MENQASVSVFLRIRPPQMWESFSPYKTYMDIDNSTDKMLIVENTPYTFDKIFYSTSTHDNIFKSVQNNIDKLIEGYNCSIIATGQSGSGKTHTMGLNERNSGLITSCLDYLFDKIDEKFQIQISFIEIYNEKVYDLLAEQTTNSIHTKGTKFAGSTKIPIKNSFDAKELIVKGNKSRHVRSTLNNVKSSRSHALISVYVNKNQEISSILHLTDLAGSEGLRTTNHSGIAQQEGVHINQGLLALGKVIQSLSSGKKLVQYRDSVLTTVLSDCLKIDSFVSIFACISPTRKDKSETLSTIRFAQKCKNLVMIPEMNAFLKEKQRLNARTPLKPYMLPTPGRMSNLSTVKKPTSVNKFNSFTTPSAKKIANDRSRYTEVINTANKESIDNNTFSIMNVSTSTEFDFNSTAHVEKNSNNNPVNQNTSIMPNFSPLIRHIEATIEKKLTNFMESFRLQMTMTEGNDVTDKKDKDTIEAVQNGIEEVRKSIQAECSYMLDSTLNVENEVPQCSTVIRPKAENKNHKRRTNRRLMTVDLTELADDKIQQSSDNKENNSSVENYTVIAIADRTRFRRSERISNLHKIVQNKCGTKEVFKKPSRKSTRSEIVEKYSKKVSKNDHKNAIMEILNKESLKGLKLLPGIGAKTAYQIITHRSVKGKFKTLNEVKKALMMSEKAWEKFLEKNMLK